MVNMSKYVLTGVDGNLGSVAASYAVEIAKPDQQLVFTSYKLAALPGEMVKLWESKGVEVREASYDDIEGMKKAFTGAQNVAFISTWLFGEGRRRQAANIIQAAKAVGVKRICYTSFVGAGLGMTAKKEDDIPFLPRDHAFIEDLVRSSGLEWNLQRNYLYLDNIATLFSPSWKFCGNKWLNNSHDQPGAYVAREDCGRVLGALLLGQGEKDTVYEVTGPEAVLDRQVFQWMCQQTGFQGQFVDMADEELKTWWAQRGLPMDFTGDFSKLPMKLCMGDLLCCGEMLARGFMAQTTDSVERLTGRKPLTYQEALLKYKDMFPKPE